MQAITHATNLRYIGATLVGTPVGRLAQLALRRADGAHLGALDGILVDSATWQCCYLVFKRAEADRRHLIPVDALIRMPCDQGGSSLVVDDEVLDDSDLDLDAIPSMSDRDLMMASPGL